MPDRLTWPAIEKAVTAGGSARRHYTEAAKVASHPRLRSWHMATNKVTVKSKSERGRWRAGLHFTRTGRPLSADDGLTEDQLRAIAEDPELVVLPYEESDEERLAREADAIAQAAAAQLAADQAAAEKAEAKRLDATRKAAEKEAAQRAAKDKKAAANPVAETGDASGEAVKSAHAASEEAKDA
ncbi:hypothetical protein [Xanthomonas campestris]|uniref:hypothetical protein n=1 Tax=Xanthomonas campestris TaxID=339 RepID=UPI001E3E7D01|nr:hypothetical protein [Xanthomonas campestris]MCC8686234.1 hypothetical protein [Xanthomonas campestris]MCW2000166.1 hypothetical protein [Xanthomonas campestris]MEA9679780.1 hypothetical protein [Xanthomonas campestris pv. raphani]MEA9699164.1 hypothetical protein [Xanthomonas campestris pv. raphani]MEA9780652.1 hypothetical protein [Xanthomonas campestris pv. raphani]